MFWDHLLPPAPRLEVNFDGRLLSRTRVLAREFWTVLSGARILDSFPIFQKDINRAADSTMFQISKNAASSWSSFVCSLSVAPFRDVPRF